ncbi:hypothetical protein SPRG_10075 [Saprolegnia parasitica CBS 223.65]|uniref:Uncharacterized protein n=1 Tax=Saprolegnia parasitica (strain CBS 223.65) TaxID=695850 RepID=A0A067BZF9_SAPPC|nr:hypothetical protein SPRG_10075 [Saprolegnia parasitica CBS 223.65]KDO23929.1 hypothetical protein SPRG_10075 [Saprolegnia parasitica CBS 223.65]|eukprot:XP_012205394.1 hypothetical protein SPRG_10075 [Saprolegnia parasitica CBS 223.65]
MMPEVDDDALSVASDSTCSEHEEDVEDDRSACRLADSLDLSVAFATPPKAHAKGPSKAAVCFEKDRAPPTQRTLRHAAPIVSAVPKHAGTVAPARVIATTKPIATESLRATSAVPAPQVHTLQPAVQPTLGRPLQELAKTSPPAELTKKLPPAEPVQMTPPTQLAKKAQFTEPVKKATEPTKTAPVVVTKPAAPTDVRATRRPVSPLKPVQTTSMSMEEDALRREIAQLDSKLGGLRQDVVSSDEDETPVVAAYGGGAHVRVGTRTAPGDRCSLEKRRATASVQATRVRKGPSIETPSLEKPAKADKVVVKKEFAFLFM